MKKKIIFLLTAVVLATTGFIGESFVHNDNQVQAVTIYRYTIPKRYRGYWHNNRTWLRITKHTISGTYISNKPKTTYHGSNALSMRLKFTNRFLLAWTGGKNLWFCYPNGEESNAYRSGSKLKLRVDTWTETLHR